MPFTGLSVFIRSVVPRAGAGPAALADGIVDAIKAGVLAHDIGLLGDSVEGGADIVGEVLLKSPDFLRVIGAPRPTIGGSVNTNGKTDYIYFDMT
jgi:lipid A 3-O-deacylase